MRETQQGAPGAVGEPGPAPRPPTARQLVRHAAVLGAGTMGLQLAALLAGQGISCDLLDLPSEGRRDRLAEEAKRRLPRLRPSPLYSLEALDLIRPGNVADHLARLGEADWVIEAVAERLDVKRDLWGRVAQYLRADAIASTNTSGIPIAAIAEALPPERRPRFLGTHFFNPPRYLRLLELIPTKATDPAVVAAIRGFGEQVLGKGVVVACDVPSFIGNRVGVYGLMTTLRAMEALGMAPDEVDGVTGRPMGRPGSATFRTLDLVGLDVVMDVCDNTRAALADPQEKAAFEIPPYLREMVKRGWTGEKAGQGFYKRVESGPEPQVIVLQLDTLEYRPRKRLQAPSLAAVQEMEDPGERLRTLVYAEDVAGRLAWRVLAPVLVYAAQKVGEVADDIASIDQAMRWGFGWELGPFEAWDALGISKTVPRMQADGLAVPEWVVRLAESNGSFYRHEAKRTLQITPQVTYTPVPEDERAISVQRLRSAGAQVAGRPGATLYDVGDGVAFLDFHSPRQAIGPDMVEMMEESARRVPQHFRGLVIGSHVQPNFSVGANLMLVLLAAQEGEWQELDAMARRFQGALLRLKRLPFPVVAAPYGRTLGGGAELALSADRVVAAAECYMGLVEVGAGLIPAGGGCKEMLVRALEGLSGGLTGRRPTGGPPPLLPDPGPNAAVARIYETIGLAKVSTSAVEAQGLGFLRPADVVVPNPDHLLHVAKEAVIALDTMGYAPPLPARLPVLGPGTRALLELAAQHQVWAGYASEHDLKIARKLAYVLTGGDWAPGSLVEEEVFLDLEREAFLSLCGEPKTQARMQHLLRTGQPLRN